MGKKILFFFKKGTIYTRQSSWLELACSWSDITTREIEKRKREAVGVVYKIMFQIAALSLNRPEQIVCKITQGTLLWVKHLTQTTQRLPQCEFVVFLNLVNMFCKYSEKRWITAFESCLRPDFGRGDNSSAVVRAACVLLLCTRLLKWLCFKHKVIAQLKIKSCA